MRRLVSLLAVILGLAGGGFAVAQDQGTPPAVGTATPDVALCATPVADAAVTPATVVVASSPAATPGAVEPGIPVGLYPCATPVDGTPASETQGVTEDADTAEAMTIQFVDIAFIPAELTIPANTDVSFHFVNNGAAVHNFMIDEPEVFSGDLGPGSSSDLVVNLPAGTYEFYCTIPGHAQAGIVGILLVQ